MKPEARTSERGFTLVEILLAVAIGGALMSMVFVVINTLLRSRQVIVDFSTPYAAGPQILDAIEADLRNAYFYDFEDNDAFWGADAEIAGREADGISFLAATLGHVGEQELRSTRQIGQAEETHRRRSPMTEVQYVCRQSPANPDFLELWRREDFYVDDLLHDGGIYRLVNDRVFDFKLEYVGRSTGPVAFGVTADESTGQMRRDGWSSIEERGLPRAVIVSVSIYAREQEKAWDDEPQVFVFRRWIPLPQVHMSAQSEGQLATWDGKITEKPVPIGPPKKGGAGGKGGKGGPGPVKTTQGGQGSNQLSTIFNRAPRGGGNAGPNPFADLFKPK
jgi:prepilin-type N-terminal cleavage/methylation domain-containing protein